MKKSPFLLAFLFMLSACGTQPALIQAGSPLVPPTTQPAATPTLPVQRTGPVPTMLPIQTNNFYGIPQDSPEWLIIPIGREDNPTPFNILVLGTDMNCRLTINAKTDFSNLSEQRSSVVLGSHTWQILKTYQAGQQVDEIYYPDIYPQEDREGGGIDGNGYAAQGFYDSCRQAIQRILANVP